jgi:uncharacterized protein (TIGR02266 family)
MAAAKSGKEAPPGTPGGGDGGKPERTSRARNRRLDVNLEFESLAQFTQYVSNISRTGCFLRSRDPWPVGTRLKLRFTLLADDPEILEALGEVVRVSERPRGMGLKFLQLPLAARKVIDRLLARPAPAPARRPPPSKK